MSAELRGFANCPVLAVFHTAKAKAIQNNAHNDCGIKFKTRFYFYDWSVKYLAAWIVISCLVFVQCIPSPSASMAAPQKRGECVCVSVCNSSDFSLNELN